MCELPLTRSELPDENHFSLFSLHNCELLNSDFVRR
jgi:hypothetical protein